MSAPDRADRDLARKITAQLGASDSPPQVWELTADEQWTLAATLTNLVRRAGWTPPQS